MAAENNFSKEMMKMWKGAWATYVKTLETMWSQGEDLLDSMMSKNPFMQEEHKQVFRDWAKQSKKSGDACVEMFNENLTKLEEMLK